MPVIDKNKIETQEQILAETIESIKTFVGDKKYQCIYVDPPWQFQNRTGKVAPEHGRLTRYSTLPLDSIMQLPIADCGDDCCHLYLWVPNALLPDGIKVMNAWGFEYKSNLVWEKVRKDGEPDGRGVGFYFRNVTEILLFGVKTPKKNLTFRTLPPARSQVNLIRSMKREHSRKPDSFYDLIERCSPAPRLELFARGTRDGWDCWGAQADDSYEPDWATYANHTVANGK